MKSHEHSFEGTLLVPLVRRLEAPPRLSWWERRFLENYEKGVSDMVFRYNKGLHRSHPTRGWTPKPNMKTGTGLRYTTNSHGWRSLYEFGNDPERYQVIIVGDSFAFGDEVDDSDTWPHLLQQLDERLNVINMGVTGYGIDQMYLTLSEATDEFAPQLTIAAFIGDDLNRSLLDFRDYKKPRFVLDKNGELKLTNTPIGSPAEVYQELQQRHHRSTSELINLSRSAGRSSEVVEKEQSSWFFLNERLFAHMEKIARKQDAEFLMLYLPSGPELVDPSLRTPGERFFQQYQKTHGNLFLNPRQALLEAPFKKSEEHYKLNETKLISQLVYRFIHRLHSWKQFLNSQQ